MVTLTGHFDSLLSAISPGTDRLQLAQRIPAEVREHLEFHESFLTEEPHSLLIGSYARSTAVGKVKDVDVLVFIKTQDDPPSPASVLSDLRDALADMPDVGEPDLRTQRRSVRVEFPAYDFTMDVVPACAPDGTDEPLRVPDRKQGEWIDSDPLGYIKYLTEKNDASKNSIRPTVRLLKHWRNYQMQIRRPKSYLLEAMIVAEMSKLSLVDIGLQESVQMAISAVYDRCSPAYEKPGGVPRVLDPMLGFSLSSQWTRSDFETFMHRLEDTDRWAEQAVASGDHDTAVELWHKVFGDAFPIYEPTCPFCRGASLNAARAAGTLAVTHGASPRVALAPTTASTPVPAKSRLWGRRNTES